MTLNLEGIIYNFFWLKGVHFFPQNIAFNFHIIYIYIYIYIEREREREREREPTLLSHDMNHLVSLVVAKPHHLLGKTILPT